MDKVLIVTSDDYTLYQPTILNLYDFLQKDFEVSIICFEPSFLGRKKDATRNVIYLQSPFLKRKLSRLVDLCTNAVLKRLDKYLFKFTPRSEWVRRLKYKILTDHLKGYNPRHVIAVDIMPLVAAQKVFERSHFLSLEIISHDSYFKKMDTARIQSVIIQNESRYQYLFNDLKLPVFYIQNAPFCENIYIHRGTRSHLLWAGSIVKEFAVFSCLDFIRSHPEYTLFLKGAANNATREKLQEKYSDLLSNGKVVVDESYLPAGEYIKYISKFSIGFCFYGWKLIKNNFNYQSAPSGKLFMYLAAGVPVIACNIPAFEFLKEFKAGVLVDDYEPATIYNAIKTIENDYEKYRENCYAAAGMFCFDNNAVKFSAHLKKLSENVST